MKLPIITGLIVAFWLGWQIYGAIRTVGNPWQRVAQTISEAAK